MFDFDKTNLYDYLIYSSKKDSINDEKSLIFKTKELEPITIEKSYNTNKSLILYNSKDNVPFE